jgi:hypothetical protein
MSTNWFLNHNGYWQQYHPTTPSQIPKQTIEEYLAAGGTITTLPTFKTLPLKYPGCCAVCHEHLKTGTRANWYPETKTITHLDCQQTQ